VNHTQTPLFPLELPSIIPYDEGKGSERELKEKTRVIWSREVNQHNDEKRREFILSRTRNYSNGNEGVSTHIFMCH